MTVTWTEPFALGSGVRACTVKQMLSPGQYDLHTRSGKHTGCHGNCGLERCSHCPGSRSKRARAVFPHATLGDHVADHVTAALCVPPQRRDIQQVPRERGEMAWLVACALSEMEGDGFSQEGDRGSRRLALLETVLNDGRVTTEGRGTSCQATQTAKCCWGCRWAGCGLGDHSPTCPAILVSGVLWHTARRPGPSPPAPHPRPALTPPPP